MFKNTKAFSGFSVDNLEKAKQFYGQTLQLDVSEGEMGLLVLNIAGGYKIIVYPKPNHIPATFTILNFPVDDIDKGVDELKERGVVFEQYKGEHINTDEKGISRSTDKKQGPNIAWFKDPAGNILSVLETQNMNTEILRELEGVTKDLFDLISSFTQKEINKIPFEGSWTAGQVAEHLFRSDSSILATVYGTAKPAERQPDLHQEELKAVFLNFDKKLNGPEEIQPTAAWHEKEALLRSLEGTRGRLMGAASLLDLSALCIHPALGELTRMEFIYFVNYHTQRHIHQLKNILQKITK